MAVSRSDRFSCPLAPGNRYTRGLGSSSQASASTSLCLWEYTWPSKWPGCGLICLSLAVPDSLTSLRPIAGRAALFLFSAGIVGTGLLTVPVLANSAAYAVGEAMKWPTGINRKPLDAKGFYIVLVVATCLGLALNLHAVQQITQLSAIRALFWSAVINGVLAAPIMAVMMLMSRNPKIMGPLVGISKGLNVMGWVATAAMAFAVIAMFATWRVQ